MTRTARLLRLVQLLGVCAQFVSEFDVPERTIDRDPAGLTELGIPPVQNDGRYRLLGNASRRESPHGL